MLNKTSFYLIPLIAASVCGSALAAPAASMAPTVATASTVSTNDPFNDNNAAYEKLLQQTRQASVESKLEEEKLQIAQAKAKQAALADGGVSKSSSSPGAMPPQVEARLAALENQIKALSQAKEHRSVDARHPSAPKVSANPVLDGIVDTAQGREAWLKVDNMVSLVSEGGHVGPWKVNAISADTVLVSRGRHSEVLTPAQAWAGTVRVTDPVGNAAAGGSNFGSYGGAPGSTPGSQNAINQNNASAVVSALRRDM